jgi:hypothetical protein
MHFSSRAVALATSLSFLLAGCGSSSSSGPLIVAQPVSAAIVDGSNNVLSVVASGDTLSYQWYLNGSAITGATAATYAATDAGTYYVVVTAADGIITSANAVISVTSAPVITAQPSSATILAGSSQALAVGADGAELAYQWYKDGSAISGATHATYAATAAGSYTAVVSNTAGSVTSAAAVIATSASVTAPSITSQPSAQRVNAGTAVTFTIVAGGASLAYQWYRNDVAIAGATADTFTIASATANSVGTYKAVVTNSAGSIASTEVGLAVNVTSAGANTAAVVSAANAFLATLGADQKTVATDATAATTVQFEYALSNANQWTNLPGNRHGLRLNASTLTAAQLAAANKVIAKALGAGGIRLFDELRAADQVLATAQTTGGAGGMQGTPPTGTGTGTPPTGAIPTDPGTGTPPTGTGTGVGTGLGTIPTDAGAFPGAGTGTGGAMAMGYGRDLYSIAFVGTPSTSSPWILQVAGHHLAYNITYNTGKVSATPTFIGVEPPDWSVASDGTVSVTNSATSSGTAHAPMERQRAAMYNLAESIYSDSTTSAAAKLAGTFTDVLMGASGNSDANYKSLVYPTSARGLQYTAMTATQKAYVRAAIEAWVNTQAHDVAATLLGDYLSDAALADTYVGYGVGQNGTKADFSAYPNAKAVPLDAQRSYMRIDGPRVWIEFVVQQGVIYGTNVHYHTIWRDKTNDYGGSF